MCVDRSTVSNILPILSSNNTGSGHYHAHKFISCLQKITKNKTTNFHHSKADSQGHNIPKQLLNTKININ